MFGGADVDDQRNDRLVHPVDIAPTLSAYVGAKPPSGAKGELLLDVLKR